MIIKGHFDNPLPRHQTLDDLYYPPLPSRASRWIGLRSKGAGRAHIPAYIGDQHRARMIHCESLLEYKCAITLLARNDIADLIEQPPPVYYFDDAEQSWNKHYFDFFVRKTDGTTIAIAVRPEARAKKLRAIVATIADQVANYADYYKVVTDAHFTEASVKNADLILSVRQDADRTADAAVRAVIATLNGATTIGAIIAATKLEGAAFRAAARLIDQGELEIENNALIDYRAPVRRSSTRRAAA